ncbi:acyltransferase [Cytobacillus firmus]|uniref:acyltransferase n=1 Tax=Cytobacillus firmus TaxID=1399 RepID=UPI0018CD779A
MLGMVLSFFILPFAIISGFIASRIGRFSDFNMILGYIPLFIGEYTRYFYYKIMLKSVGKNVIFKFGSYCQYRNTVIGDNCLIGFFNALGEVHMGNDVLVGGYVNFTSGLNQHSFADPAKKIREQPGHRMTINIGDDSWIGNNCIVCADVGTRTVVGAGSIVVKNLIESGVYVGSPAKKVKDLESVRIERA